MREIELAAAAHVEALTLPTPTPLPATRASTPPAPAQPALPPADTVYFGGGTPTLLGPKPLVSILDAIRRSWGLAPDAEVTVEANPDSVTERDIAALAEGGVTRLSVGMQSASPSVLARLDRSHTPERVPDVIAWAQAAGLDTSLDLIYGTPRETMAEWCLSLDAALACGVRHISCYALTLEPATPMARQIARGDLPPVDDDDLAAKYELADQVLTSAGLPWYEISNWATPGSECRHNLGYWRGGQWWGIGAGAHSAIGHERWWNLRHPREYGAQVEAGNLPREGHDTLDAQARATEHIMTRIRLAEGLPLPPPHDSTLSALATDGLIDAPALAQNRIRLTLRGRLLADTVTRALLT